MENNKFKIGFEFEFIAYDIYNSLDRSLFRKLKIRELFLHELVLCFSITDGVQKDISNFLNYACYNRGGYSYYGSPNDMVNYGTDRIVALYKLIPTKRAERMDTKILLIHRDT